MDNNCTVELSHVIILYLLSQHKINIHYQHVYIPILPDDYTDLGKFFKIWLGMFILKAGKIYFDP